MKVKTMEKKMNPIKQKKIDDLIKKGVQIIGFEEEVIKQYWNGLYSKFSLSMKGKSEEDIFNRTSRSFVATVRGKQMDKLSNFTGVVVGIGKVSEIGKNIAKGAMNFFNVNQEEAERTKRVKMFDGTPRPIDRFERIIDESQLSRNVYGYAEINGETKKFISYLKGVVGSKVLMQDIPLNVEVNFEGVLGNENKFGAIVINNIRNFKANGEGISQEEAISLMTDYFGEQKKVGELREYLMGSLQSGKKNPTAIVTGQVISMNEASSRISLIANATSFEESVGEVILVVPEEKRSTINFSEFSVITVAGELWFSKTQREGAEPEVNLTPLNIVVIENGLEGLQTTPEESIRPYEQKDAETETEL